MSARHSNIGRWLAPLAALWVAIVAASCGGGSKDSGFGALTDGSVDGSSSGGGSGSSGGDASQFGGGDGGATCKTCQQLGYTCGINSNGCGGTVNCGNSCPSGETCGGGGYSKCGKGSGDGGGGSCATCKSLGATCGPNGDGCGNLLQCGNCATGDSCEGTPSVCVSGCSGLCLKQQKCGGGVYTTLTGTVTAPKVYGSPDPVPNVLVYVPNGSGGPPGYGLAPFSTTLTCSQCGADVSGDPLVTATTAFDGTFSLVNVPVMSNLPVVIQLGKWRRLLTMSSVTACTTQPINDGSDAVGTITMPTKENEGSAFDNIPLTAVDTGWIDPLECVLVKMGVAESEFTSASGGGRIHIYQGSSSQGAGATVAGAGNENALMGGGGSFMSYDQILFPCQASPLPTKNGTMLGNLIAYADGGGHFFATHYSYNWLFGNGEFGGTANWSPDDNGGETKIVGDVQPAPTNPEGTIFTNWLKLVGALSNTSPAEVTIDQPRHDVNSVAGSSIDWIDGKDPGPGPTKGSAQLLHYTFDTPVAAPPASQCGHAIYSDFHVVSSSTKKGQKFPAECDKSAMTPQEKILEYMIWDLGQCVGTTTTKCTPKTCASFPPGTCGIQGDGCGGETANCGTCEHDSGTCSPSTCKEQGIACGPTGDGCGNILQCGGCTMPQTCGGGGTPGQCGGGSQ